MSSIKQKKNMPIGKINKTQIKKFCIALKNRLLKENDSFAKGYVNLLIDEIVVEGDKANIQGSYEELSHAIDNTGNELNKVPIFMREWCARQESNL
jgi:hypothetical protein